MQGVAERTRVNALKVQRRQQLGDEKREAQRRRAAEQAAEAEAREARLARIRSLVRAAWCVQLVECRAEVAGLLCRCR